MIYMVNYNLRLNILNRRNQDLMCDSGWNKLRINIEVSLLVCALPHKAHHLDTSALKSKQPIRLWSVGDPTNLVRLLEHKI